MLELTLLALLSLLQADAEEGHLGLTLRKLTRAEASKFDLPRKSFGRAQRVETVDPGGPAAKAKVAVGDVLLKVNENWLHSRDSLNDFLRVTRPGIQVVLTLRRAATDKEEKIKLVLGKKLRKHAGIKWEFAGWGQLTAAIAAAKKRETIVMVGLSGAET